MRAGGERGGGARVGENRGCREALHAPATHEQALGLSRGESEGTRRGSGTRVRASGGFASVKHDALPASPNEDDRCRGGGEGSEESDRGDAARPAAAGWARDVEEDRFEFFDGVSRDDLRDGAGAGALEYEAILNGEGGECGEEGECNRGDDGEEGVEGEEDVESGFVGRGRGCTGGWGWLMRQMISTPNLPMLC